MHETISLGSNAVIGCVRCEKFRHDLWHEHLYYFGPLCTEFRKATKRSRMHPNSTERQFRVRWGLLGAFVAKNSNAISWQKLLHKFGPFCTEFRKVTKWSRMHPNSTKRQFRVRWGLLGAFVAKNSNAISWHKLLHKFGPFCTEFRKAT